MDVRLRLRRPRRGGSAWALGPALAMVVAAASGCRGRAAGSPPPDGAREAARTWARTHLEVGMSIDEVRAALAAGPGGPSAGLGSHGAVSFGFGDDRLDLRFDVEPAGTTTLGRGDAHADAPPFLRAPLALRLVPGGDFTPDGDARGSR